MIDAKAAVGFAREYIDSIQAITGVPLENLRLEEIEMTEDESFWLITLGYDNPDRPSHSATLGVLDPNLARRSAREYKQFRVKADSREVKSMKIRQV